MIACRGLLVYTSLTPWKSAITVILLWHNFRSQSQFNPSTAKPLCWLNVALIVIRTDTVTWFETARTQILPQVVTYVYYEWLNHSSHTKLCNQNKLYRALFLFVCFFPPHQLSPWWHDYDRLSFWDVTRQAFHCMLVAPSRLDPTFKQDIYFWFIFPSKMPWEDLFQWNHRNVHHI